MKILTLYYICYVILAMYMLDSDQEPSYNLSKNLSLLPRILKLIEYMVDDSTPLFRAIFGSWLKYPIFCLGLYLGSGLRALQRRTCPSSNNQLSNHQPSPVKRRGEFSQRKFFNLNLLKKIIILEIIILVIKT